MTQSTASAARWQPPPSSSFTFDQIRRSVFFFWYDDISRWELKRASKMSHFAFVWQEEIAADSARLTRTAIKPARNPPFQIQPSKKNPTFYTSYNVNVPCAKSKKHTLFLVINRCKLLCSSNKLQFNNAKLSTFNNSLCKSLTCKRNFRSLLTNLRSNFNSSTWYHLGWI